MKAHVKTLWMLAGLVLPPATSFAFPSAPLVSNSSLVVADFNGDKHPDAIGLRVQSSTDSGLIYSLDFSEPGSATRTSKLVLVKRWGIEIVPRDVDGDHDLDLIVESLATHEALEILLNDGKGAFAAVDASLFPSALWHEHGSFSTDDAQRQDLGIDEDSGRDDFAVACSPGIINSAVTERFASAASSTLITRTAVHGHSRAPPRS